MKDWKNDVLQKQKIKGNKKILNPAYEKIRKKLVIMLFYNHENSPYFRLAPG